MPKPRPRVVISALGITQIVGWVVGGLPIGLLAAGLIAPRVGGTIDAKGGRRSSSPAPVLLATGLAALALAPAFRST